MSEQAEKDGPKLVLTVHCPKCRNVIGEETKLCTNCGAEVDKVGSVDRPRTQPAGGGGSNHRADALC